MITTSNGSPAARIALGQVIADGWKASLTYSYQRQLTHGAWDENTTIGGAVNYAGQLIDGPARSFGTDNVDRFGPEFKQYYAKTLDFHLDGDVGIGDLVYASTYWAQDDRWVNEYSEYMQYINTGPPSNLTAPSRQAFDCLTDPVSSGGTLPFSGCKVPIQYYDYSTKTTAGPMNCACSRRKAAASLAGRPVLGKVARLLAEFYHMPGLQTSGAQWQAYAAYYGQTGLPPAPDDWYSYVETLRLPADDGVRERHLRHHAPAAFRGRHVAFSFEFQRLYLWRILVLAADDDPGAGFFAQVGQQARISYKATDELLVYADAAQGFRDGGVNGGLPAPCQRYIPQYQPDTLTNYELGFKSTLLDKHLVWDSALYYMPWKNLQS
jgi:outer membrane receptor protein involved in Fe transport